MPRIFISYRRSDSAAIAGRMYKELVATFGKGNVFMDVDVIPLGADFRAEIERELINCDFMLVVIGRSWLNAADADGNRRLDNPADFVRIEVELGLRHRNVSVIPVLVDNAQMPTEADLPTRLAMLAFQNAAMVRNDPDFDRDLGRLIYALQSELTSSVDEGSPTPAKRRPRWPIIGIAAGLLLITIVLVSLIISNVFSQTASSTPTVTITDAAIIAQNSTSAPATVPTTLAPTITDTSTPTPSDTVTPLPPTSTLSSTDIENTVTAEMGNALRDAQFTQTANVLTREAGVTLAAHVTAAVLTATATLWTPTPSLDARGTANVRLTETQSILDATTTADSWTDTLSYTPTPTSTFIATLPPTRTPTATFTQSHTPTLTATVTPTFTSSHTVSPTVTPIPLGLSLENPVTTNAQWQPYIDYYARNFDDVDMVLVPAGCFQMGNDPNAAGYGGDEDGGTQCIEPFWIDRYEVTNGQFDQFDGQAVNDGAFSGDKRPREQITWFEARDFCALRGSRLPTEAEWEYAARGVDGLYYPWGNEWNPDNAVWAGNSNNQTADVGSRPNGASWVGAYDLIGNVWEWVSSVYLDYPYSTTGGREDETTSNVTRVLRGGSWNDNVTDLFHATVRGGNVPFVRNNWAGFRCARSYGS